jgi:Thioesterase-like superfamily
MNLWLRLLRLLVASFFRARLDPTRDASQLAFRVWPHDLDLSFHMNNGRYLTIMDLGRADLMLRSGLWRAILRHGWAPVVSAATWGETDVVMEHRLLGRRKSGGEVLSAIALARTGLYDRRARAFVPVERLFAEVGITGAASPEPAPEVAALMEADKALRQAA